MILVLDDHPIARQGIEYIIKLHKPDKKILHAGSIKEAKEYINTFDISIAFIDIHLKNESGFDFLEYIKSNDMDTKTLVITSSSSMNDFITAQKLNADAYILKDAYIEEIMYGLEVIDRGEKFYSSNVVKSFENYKEDEILIAKLSDREKEILQYLGKGFSNAEIGNSLLISEGTVKKHISNILGKLGIKNRVNAVLFAVKNSKQLGEIGIDLVM